MEILLGNDDGIHSPGLAALALALAPLGNLTVVAPDRERSGVAHALSLHTPMRLKEIRPGWYFSDGTPTDCVHLGVHAVLKTMPALIVAGINHGPNMGDDITYSGTVSMAMEGALLGIPSVAVSLATRGEADFAPAAEIAGIVCRAVIGRGLAPRTFLNVNVPVGEKPGPIRITRQGRRVFGSGVIKKTDPRGQDYYWMGGEELGYVDGDIDSDIRAVANGYVSVTPLSTDFTAANLFRELKEWKF